MFQHARTRGTTNWYSYSLFSALILAISVLALHQTAHAFLPGSASISGYVTDQNGELITDAQISVYAEGISAGTSSLRGEVSQVDTVFC